MDTYQIIIIIVVCALAMLVSAALYLLQRARRRMPEDFDLMEGHEFEEYCAELLKKCGFEDVEVTRGSGDYGIDILAEKDGVKAILDVEMSSTGQMLDDVRIAVEGRKPVRYLGHAGGMIPTVEEMAEAARAALKEGV